MALSSKLRCGLLEIIQSPAPVPRNVETHDLYSVVAELRISEKVVKIHGWKHPEKQER